MDWRILAAFTPILFVIYQAVSKMFSPSAPLFLINALASLVGAVVMIVLHFIFPSQSSSIDLKTLPLVVAIGLLISIGNFLIIKAYALGATQTGFTSIYYPLLIIYGIAFGLFFFQEKLNMYQVAGLCLSFVGVFLMVYFKK